MADDQLYETMMKMAIRLARKGEGQTSPNPMVGAVIFDDNGVVATGYHKKAGGPHAEIFALQKAGDRARGATLVVNLEPCCHHEKTGPCTEAIVEAGIKRVVYAIRDPFPHVCGRGERLLKENGIDIISGVCADQATQLNEVYLTYVKTGRPFVVLKTAQSLDGRIATSRGESHWISCPEALAFAHKLRSRYDAVAVGSGTVKADNPFLTVRHVKGRNPLRIIVSSSCLPSKINLFTRNDDHKTIVAAPRHIIDKGTYKSAITWPVRMQKGGKGLDLKDLLKQAASHGVASILFEGGGHLATSLIKQGLVDKYYLIIAPMIIGQGVSGVGDLGITRLSQAIRFAESGTETIGTDILFWGYPRKKSCLRD